MSKICPVVTSPYARRVSSKENKQVYWLRFIIFSRLPGRGQWHGWEKTRLYSGGTAPDFNRFPSCLKIRLLIFVVLLFSSWFRQNPAVRSRVIEKNCNKELPTRKTGSSLLLFTEPRGQLPHKWFYRQHPELLSARARCRSSLPSFWHLRRLSVPSGTVPATGRKPVLRSRN